MCCGLSQTAGTIIVCIGLQANAKLTSRAGAASPAHLPNRIRTPESMLKAFLRQPHQSPVRRLMFRVHLWAGLVLGIHLAIVSTTGIVLLFKDEVRAMMYPHLYRVGEAPAASAVDAIPDIDRIVASMNDDYPGYRILRIDAPKAGRGTVVIIAENNGSYHRIFAHPATGVTLGELPKTSILAYVEELHADLFAGRAGQIINSTLALLALLLVASGVIVWWPGPGRWLEALGPRSAGGGITLRSVHRTVGIWSFLFIIIFAVTGALFFYDRFVNPAVRLFSESSAPSVVRSGVPAEGAQAPARLQPMIDKARESAPDRFLWGIFMPGGDRDPVHLVFGPVGQDVGRDRWELSEAGQRNFYFDQYSGNLLHQWDTEHNTLADFVYAWPYKLHTGEFGGQWGRALWTVAGLAPPILFVLGFILWRRRERVKRRVNQRR